MNILQKSYYLFDENIKRTKIGDIVRINRGKIISKRYIFEHPGDYPVYSSQTENSGCLGYIDTYDFDDECCTWTTDGAKAGTVFYRKGKFSITNVCGMMTVIDKSKISCKYLSYLLPKVLKKYVRRDIPNAKLMSNTVAAIEIPIPPLSTQKEIVRKLDELNKLEGLLAEIEARKQQYEYYRDKLLTFDKLQIL